MFGKKRKKDVNDYYRNELMRSRMSPISIRTDEIIQQYFFVAKDQFLNLEEYLKIRELSTKELGMVEATRVVIAGTPKAGKQNLLINPMKDDAEVNRLRGENRNNKDAEPLKEGNLPQEPLSVPSSATMVEKANLPIKEEKPAEGVVEPEKASGVFSDEDFLAMMQSVED